MKPRLLPQSRNVLSHKRSIATPAFARPTRFLLKYPRRVKVVSSGQSSLCIHTQSPQEKKPLPRQGKRLAALPLSDPLEPSHTEVLLDDALKLLDSKNPPTERHILKSLTACEDLARTITPQAISEHSISRGVGSKNAGNNLLFLDEGESSGLQDDGFIPAAVDSGAILRLSDTAYMILKDRKIFITAEVLRTYVSIQCLLGKPESFPEVFSLYANKPAPLEGSSPVEYMAAKPHRASSAVPSDIARAALNAAIKTKNMPLCLDIISTTVCSPAFQRNKIIKRALFPLTGFALAPIAAYVLADHIAHLQQTMSSEVARNMSFAGIASYIGFTATIGYVALTTANDQMDRITWADGTPLRERWLREEERAMMDRVASSWGFRESRRKGEEEGPEWEALKELVGLRGMILDRVELMEGME
ncbi:MAG: hypothetical protein MMC23_004978 [Stictis urceolatum]|nr:hypothetical protein [Stictis urceolata]